MSELGSLYIKLGEPEGELCGCTCEVGDWAAKHIVDLTEQRDKLLAALVEVIRISDRDHDAWNHAKALIAEAKGEK